MLCLNIKLSGKTQDHWAVVILGVCVRQPQTCIFSLPILFEFLQWTCRIFIVIEPKKDVSTWQPNLRKGTCWGWPFMASSGRWPLTRIINIEPHRREMVSSYWACPCCMDEARDLTRTCTLWLCAPPWPRPRPVSGSLVWMQVVSLFTRPVLIQSAWGHRTGFPGMWIMWVLKLSLWL